MVRCSLPYKIHCAICKHIVGVHYQKIMFLFNLSFSCFLALSHNFFWLFSWYMIKNDPSCIWIFYVVIVTTNFLFSMFILLSSTGKLLTVPYLAYCVEKQLHSLPIALVRRCFTQTTPYQKSLPYGTDTKRLIFRSLQSLLVQDYDKLFTSTYNRNTSVKCYIIL